IPPAIFFYYSILFDSRFKTLQQNQIVNNSLGTDFTYLDFIGDEGKVANGFSEKIIQFQENRSKLN
ncbi:hypothetical protein V7H27_14695, partial [Enterococcus faecium]|uniref:hypothetical protein n=1 Tax=Enterococcus faecium TaxID=1352 RepID=UPI001B82229F